MLRVDTAPCAPFAPRPCAGRLVVSRSLCTRIPVPSRIFAAFVLFASPYRMPHVYTPQSFVSTWRNSELKERAAAQEHFIGLCRIIGHPTPAESDKTGASFTFEAGVGTIDGGSVCDRSRRNIHRCHGERDYELHRPVQTRVFRAGGKAGQPRRGAPTRRMPPISRSVLPVHAVDVARSCGIPRHRVG